MNAVNKLVKDLQEAGVLVEIEDHMHSVGHSERSGAVVEPYLINTMVRKNGNHLQKKQLNFNKKKKKK